MKITHVIESSGGSADFVLYLVEHLHDHEHTVIHGDRTFGTKLDQVRSSYRNVRFIFWPNAQREIRVWTDIKATINLYRILHRHKADVIHLHSSKGGFLGRVVCFFLQRKNVIYTPNGLSFLRRDVSPIKRRLYVWLERTAHLLAGRVISCSRSEAEEMSKIGIPSGYINNGTRIFETPAPNPLNRREIVVATTGRITIQKNPSLFNQIAKGLESEPAFKFLWIGGGELENELTSQNITKTGWLDRKDVIQQLKQIDIYLSTASWEGLPFAVLEAMNMQKPLVLTRCVGNVDLVREDQNGFLFDTAEEAMAKIRRLYETPSLISAFGSESQKLAKLSFDVRSMASQYESVYQQTRNSEQMRALK